MMLVSFAADWLPCTGLTQSSGKAVDALAHPVLMSKENIVTVCSLSSSLTPVSPLLQHDAAPQSSLCGSCDPVADSAEPSSGFDQRPQT